MTMFSRRRRAGKETMASALALIATCLLATLLFPSVAAAAPTCRGKPVTINMNTNGGNGNGTSGNDVILGTPGNDIIKAGLGVDTICAGAGNDYIDGGGGSDRIKGEGGHDTIYAGSGADDVWGGSGWDKIYGQGGKDDIWGEQGNDTIQGNHHSDKLYGGPGDDTIGGAGGLDQLYGEDGNDTLNGGHNSDTLYGGPGNDMLNGGSGSDTANGGTGSDTCLNSETQTGCGPDAPPQWVTKDFNIDRVWAPFYFTVNWCCRAGGELSHYELRVTEKDGRSDKWLIGAHNNTFEVPSFQGLSFGPGDDYTVALTMINAAGRSETLTQTLSIPDLNAPTQSDERLDPEPVAFRVRGAQAVPWQCGTKRTVQLANVPIAVAASVVFPVLPDGVFLGEHTAQTRTCLKDDLIWSNAPETHLCEVDLVSIVEPVRRYQPGQTQGRESSNVYTCDIQGELHVKVDASGKIARIVQLGTEADTTIHINKQLSILHRTYFNPNDSFPLWVHIRTDETSLG